MCTTNRNRRDHRSAALCLISIGLAVLLLAVPAAAANTADYTIAEDGKSFFADVYFTDLGTFSIVTEGIFWGLGGDSELKGVTDLVLTNTDTGEVVTPASANGVLTFPKGNYHLTFTAPLETGIFGGTSLYLKYPAPFDVTVTMPDPYTTGHFVLGKVNDNGVISHNGTETIVTYTGIEKTKVPYYNKMREPVLYAFAGIWVVVLLIAIWRYRSLKKKQSVKRDL